VFSSSNLLGWAMFFLSLIVFLVGVKEVNTFTYWLFVAIFFALMVASTIRGRFEDRDKKNERKNLTDAIETLTKEVRDGFANQQKGKKG
jgi:Flp pilus assembly protein TadB